jgi:hypothetical protein
MNKEKHMSHVFDINTTRRQQILVEYLTPAGSGFAITPQGEQVFMNKRLIDAMNVKEGDIYDAYLLPNYPDKQSQIPWRAMRVEPTNEGMQDLSLDHVISDSVVNKLVKYMEEQGQDLPHNAHIMAEDLELDPEMVVEKMNNNPDIFYRDPMAYVLCQ